MVVYRIKQKNKYEKPRVRHSFHLLSYVCTEITTSFAKTTSPGGQNEAAHCSAADRGRAKICSTDWLSFNVQLKGNSPSLTTKCPSGPNQWLTLQSNPRRRGVSSVIAVWPFDQTKEKYERYFQQGSFRTSYEKRNNNPTKQAIYPPAVLHGVIVISCDPRMQSALDSGTAPQFGNNKGVLPNALRDDAFRLEALHIKQTGLSVSAQAPCNKVYVILAETLRIVTQEFLHWERLTNTQRDSSVQVSTGERLVTGAESHQQKDAFFVQSKSVLNLMGCFFFNVWLIQF